MLIHKQLRSKALNTFGIDVNLSQVISIESKEDLYYLYPHIKNQGSRILGGGSNVLMTTDIKVPVLLVENKGIEVIKEGEDYVLVSVMAGETWHDLVLWCIDKDYGGIENLALIPGKCGAAPMQNIGAYGVELKDVCHTVHAFSLVDGHEYSFFHEECGFGYRTSHFKTKWKDKYIITEIILRLTKSGSHRINTGYGAIKAELESDGLDQPTIKNVADVVIRIRQRKLPDPKEIGNAGSFFKNPVISVSSLAQIQEDHPNVPHYPIDSENVKVPAGWLIEQCGWKGKRVGETGTYKNQALVLINHGQAEGAKVLSLSEDIKQSVLDTFDIELDREVNVW